MKLLQKIQKKFEGSKCGDLQPLEPIDLQVEISGRDENATGNWNTIAQKKSIFMCIGSSANRRKSPRLENKQQLTTNLVVQSNEPKDIVCTNSFEAPEVEKELELVDSNPTKEQTLVQANFDNSIQSVRTPIGVCIMQTKKNDSVMSPTLYIFNPEVAKIIQESETAMLLKLNSAIKSLMVTSNTSTHEVSKEKQREMSTPRWADLVDEEEHVSPPLLNRKLSPQVLEFVPKSIIAKKNEQEALASEFSPTRGYD
ncbi:hypothetical protein MTR67_028146 [Solanum verrucosum]|uniref:Uncharacterized protein n=1 Tax=Solanum verrucosum TaxID=315347 RepID=A0AAF0TW39_SOLVR|nr:hypothetical protein MTR67_028146 [Solanum verrucosum]